MPIELKLIDFQQCRLGSPGLDLNQFLYTSLEKGLLKTKRKYFLEIYTATFNELVILANVPKTVAPEIIEDEFRTVNLYGLIQGSFLIPVIRSLKENVPDFSETADGDRDAAFAEINRRMVESARQDPVIVNNLLDMFDDVMASGCLKKVKD